MFISFRQRGVIKWHLLALYKIKMKMKVGKWGGCRIF